MTKAPDSVGEIMTKDVVTVAPEDTVETAVRAMVTNDIGSAVVVRGDNAVGVFTERDLLRHILDRPDVLQRPVGEVMACPVISTTPDAAIVDAFGLITARNIRRLPIIDGGRLVGIVTERDLLRWVRDVAEE